MDEPTNLSVIATKIDSHPSYWVDWSIGSNHAQSRCSRLPLFSSSVVPIAIGMIDCEEHSDEAISGYV